MTSWVVRRQRTDDVADRDAVTGVLHAAFGADGPHVATLTGTLQAADASADGIALVAEDPDDAGRVVGFVLLVRGWVDAPSRLVDVHVLSPLAVLPSHQRRGVARALVEEAVRQAVAVGSPAVFLEGNPEVYPHLGFAAGRPRFEQPSVRIPDVAFFVRTLPGCGDDVAGRLVYPDAFWSADAVGLR